MKIKAPSMKVAPFPFTCYLVFSDDKWRQICKQHKLEHNGFLRQFEQAQVAYFGGNCCYVKFSDLSEFDLFQIVGVVAHEMVHVFQFACQHASEENPSTEFQAYSVGNLVEWAFEEYNNYHCRVQPAQEVK